MKGSALTRDRILEAAEDVLRRFGPDKATVVDVARELGVSHGSVYRHFPSKAALRDAVTERWLGRISTPLAAIAAERDSASRRLRRWLAALIGVKRRLLRDDPELFATYVGLAAGARDVVRAHVDSLASQISRIVGDGVARGEFVVSDPVAAGRAVLHATARFHDPGHAAEWSDPGIDAAFQGVWRLILRGLGGGEKAVRGPSPRRRRSSGERKT